MTGLGRTQWVDQTISNVRDALVAKGVDLAWLPRELPASRAPRPGSVEEFGCGAYGCVMPTNQAGLVLKITSDTSEAWFAQIAHELAQKEGWPKGIVHYRRVIGLADQSLDNQPLFLLWRSEAFEVGKLSKTLPALTDALEAYMVIVDHMYQDADALQKFDRRTLRAATSKDMLADGRDYVLEQAEAAWSLSEISERAMMYDDVHFEMAVHLLCLYAVAEVAEQAYPETHGVGSTIRYYLDKGLLLTDLHMGNVGLSGGGTAVIADPGLVVPMKAPWFDTPFPKRLLVRS